MSLLTVYCALVGTLSLLPAIGLLACVPYLVYGYCQADSLGLFNARSRKAQVAEGVEYDAAR